MFETVSHGGRLHRLAARDRHRHVVLTLCGIESTRYGIGRAPGNGASAGARKPVCEECDEQAIGTARVILRVGGERLSNA